MEQITRPWTTDYWLLDQGTAMLFGPQAGVVVAVQPIDIHGTRMVDVAYRLDGETEARAARLGMESLPGVLRPGDRVVVHLLMNVATRIEPEQD